MAKLKRKFRALPLAALCLLIVGGAAFAQRQIAATSYAGGRPAVKVALSGIVEREGESVGVEKVAAVNPGEILNWTITSQKDGTAPAREYKALGQIPRATAFVAGSATADGSATVVYSIDNVKTFSAEPMIEQQQADGSRQLVPAPVSLYTQVRYEWSSELVGGSTLSASYKVRVK